MRTVPRWLVFVFLAALLLGCQRDRGKEPVSTTVTSLRDQLVSRLLARIPEGATISIQPELMSYIGPKGSPYLFPVVSNAEYVLADITFAQDFAVMRGIHDELQGLLDSGQFGVVDAEDGLVLLRRGDAGQRLPESFYGFIRAGAGQSAHPLRARFGDAMDLVAFDYERSGSDLKRIVTYWRAARHLDGDYRLAFFLSAKDGLQTDTFENSSLASIWYPPNRWQTGELIKVELPAGLITRGTSLVRVAVYAQQDQRSRVALPAYLPEKALQGEPVTVLDLSAAPEGNEDSLAHITSLPSPPVPAPTPTPSPAGAPAISLQESRSLCGKPLDDPALARLRPVAVKIDNASPARPQTGLDEACIVYEHMAEGGITRFTAIYQTENTEIGPVRSARLVDLNIVPQYQALFAHVGGAPPEMRLIKESGLPDVDQFFNAGAYRYNRQRAAPYNVYTSVSDIRRQGENLGYTRDVDLEGFIFSENPPEEGSPATDVLLPFIASSKGEFRYDAQGRDYVRYTADRPHIDASTGQAVRAKNIIIQHVPVIETPYIEDVNGAHSVDHELIGEGEATVIRDGVAMEGKWVRPNLESWTHFYDQSGQPIPLAPGKVWISLVGTAERVDIH